MFYTVFYTLYCSVEIDIGYLPREHNLGLIQRVRLLIFDLCQHVPVAFFSISKIRLFICIVDDDFRPYLMSFGKNKSNYINAVIIPVGECLLVLIHHELCIPVRLVVLITHNYKLI